LPHRVDGAIISMVADQVHDSYSTSFTCLLIMPGHRVGALSDEARLTSVCLTSVAYIGPKSRTERPRKTKIQWGSPRDQGLGLEAPRGQQWKSWSWSWSWIINSWSQSRSWRKIVLLFFKTYVVILDGSEQGTPWHVRDKDKDHLQKGEIRRGINGAL